MCVCVITIEQVEVRPCGYGAAKQTSNKSSSPSLCQPSHTNRAQTCAMHRPGLQGVLSIPVSVQREDKSQILHQEYNDEP